MLNLVQHLIVSLCAPYCGQILNQVQDDVLLCLFVHALSVMLNSRGEPLQLIGIDYGRKKESENTKHPSKTALFTLFAMDSQLFWPKNTFYQ